VVTVTDHHNAMQMERNAKHVSHHQQAAAQAELASSAAQAACQAAAQMSVQASTQAVSKPDPISVHIVCMVVMVGMCIMHAYRLDAEGIHPGAQGTHAFTTL
jgi:hypothetical protein